MPSIPTLWIHRLLVAAAGIVLLASVTAHAEPLAAGSTAIPPLPAGLARIWIYRDYLPSESLNMAVVKINGGITGYAQAAGGSFYRDVRPGQYLVTVESYGRDTNQSADLTLGAGQEAYVKIESLRSWSSSGERTSIERDTFYARPIAPPLARAEMAHLPYLGGG
jgi:hypothetical protein